MGAAQGVCTRSHFVLWQGDMYLATTCKGHDISNLLAGQGFEGGVPKGRCGEGRCLKGSETHHQLSPFVQRFCPVCQSSISPVMAKIYEAKFWQTSQAEFSLACWSFSKHLLFEFQSVECNQYIRDQTCMNAIFVSEHVFDAKVRTVENIA